MTIQEAIRKMSVSGQELYCKICIVDSIDEVARTIDCTPLDEGAPLSGVNLQANQEEKDGLVVFPAKGSYVVVAFLSPAVGVVVLSETVEKIEIKIGEITATMNADGVIFNGGDLGGLVNVGQLTQKLNDLIDAYNGHTHTIPTGNVAVTGTAAAQSNPAPVTVPAIMDKHQKVAESDYEDTKIKH